VEALKQLERYKGYKGLNPISVSRERHPSCAHQHPMTRWILSSTL